MAKELPGYRDQLESVLAAFPDRECLNVQDVAAYTGIGRKTAARIFPFVGHGVGRYITRTSLARALVDVGQRAR